MMKAFYLIWLGCIFGVGNSLAAAPINDNFNNAIDLTGTDFSSTGSNVGATKELSEPNHGENVGGASVWWSWTAPADGSVVIQTLGSTFDTLLAAYTGSSLATLSSVASNDDAGSLKTSLIGFNVTSGTTYHIAVDGYGGDTGDIELALKFQAQSLQRPANDNFADRLSLAGLNVTNSASNFFASKEPLEPDHADEVGGASVWWTWTTPAAGTAVISTHGSDFDTLLAVYTGDVLTNLTLVASSDDISTNDPTSSVTFAALPNLAYQIAVDGFDGEPGHIQLQILVKDILTLAPPQLQPDGGVKLTLNGPVGRSEEFQGSTDFATWSPLMTLTNTTGVLEWTDPSRTNRVRFYRVQQGP